MLLVVAAAVLLALNAVPGEWGFAILGAAVAVTIGEAMLMRSTLRLPPAAGVETMIGETAVVVSSCRPTGRVRYRRESWKARCAGEARADVGETVVIDSVERLTLVVSPAAEK